MAGLSWQNRDVTLTPPKVDDKDVKCEFAFTNTGQQSVTIESLKASCGCTTAELAKRTYAPGESGSISVVFTTGDRQGFQVKQVSVKSDDADSPTVLLTLHVELPTFYDVQPRLVSWVVGTEAIPKAVTVVVNSQIAKGPLFLVSSPGTLRCKIAIKAIQPDLKYEVTVTPPEDLSKPFTEQIELSTDVAANRRLLRIFAAVREADGVKSDKATAESPKVEPTSSATK